MIVRPLREPEVRKRIAAIEARRPNIAHEANCFDDEWGEWSMLQACLKLLTKA